MDVWWTYSVQDFILFSKQTWLLLYAEYAANWWWLFLVLITLFLLCCVYHWLGKKTLWVALAYNQGSYLTCLLYYWLFCHQINLFASYFAAALLLQMGLNLATDFRAATASNRRWTLFVDVHKDRRRTQLCWLAGLTLVAVNVAVYLGNTPAVWLLPGLHPIASLSLLLLSWRLQGKTPGVVYLMPGCIIIIELLTLYAVELHYWWGFLCMFLLLCWPLRRSYNPQY
ncbi:hypothetical protein [Planctobacterium marinum]|uniref:hypothetical protein n=1 Tax=Planctobacterium marinum TaxID=1631968 RepID=UPI001E485ADC|nr:hypothetical protein [Planctobacterium marinum]MCC2604407.1 hypothetical protein [Planctobacterium marinum]